MGSYGSISVVIFVGPYGFLLVILGPYWSLLVRMGFYWSLFFFAGPYGPYWSLRFLWDFRVSNWSLRIHMGPCELLFVFKMSCGSLWIFIGP